MLGRTNASLKGKEIQLTGTATREHVLQEETFYSDDPTVKLIGTMVNRGAVSKSITPSLSQQTYIIPQGYHSGSGKIVIPPVNLSSHAISGFTIAVPGGKTTEFSFSPILDPNTKTYSILVWAINCRNVEIQYIPQSGGDFEKLHSFNTGNSANSSVSLGEPAIWSADNRKDQRYAVSGTGYTNGLTGYIVVVVSAANI